MAAHHPSAWPHPVCLSLSCTLGPSVPKRGHRGALSSWSPAPAPSAAPLRLSWGSPDGTACLSCTCPSWHHPPGLAPACTPAWRTPHPHPVPLLNAPWVFSGPPTSVQARDGCVDSGSTGGRAFPAVGRDLGTYGGRQAGRTQVSRLGAGQVQRGRAQRVLSLSGFPGCLLCSLIWAPPPVATVAGSGRLGSSLRAGWREGGGWQGPRPGMCVQECDCSAH